MLIKYGSIITLGEGDRIMQFLVLYPPDDEDIKACMSRWLSEAGGTLSWDEVQKKLYERFKYVTKSIHNEEEVRQMNLKDKAYLIKDGMVSCQ